MSSVPGSNYVLIVEDNELNMKLFNDLLRAHGFDTVTSIDGLDALDLARRYNPFVIIMDIQLPTLSGIDLTRQIKQDPDLLHIPVIAVTAFSMPNDAENIRAAGCDHYMTKPISITQFVQAVQKYKF